MPRFPLTRSGIHTLRSTYGNGLLLPIALFKFRIWEPLTRQSPKSGVVPIPAWLNSLLYGALYLESKLVDMGFNLPLGQSLIFLGNKRSPAK